MVTFSFFWPVLRQGHSNRGVYSWLRPVLRRHLYRQSGKFCCILSQNVLQSNCGRFATIHRTLANMPEVISIGLIWDSERPSFEHIRGVVNALSTELQPQDVSNIYTYIYIILYIHYYSINGIWIFSFCSYPDANLWLNALFRTLQNTWSTIESIL